MLIFGYHISDIASAVTILSAGGLFISFVFRYAVHGMISDLVNQLKELSSTIHQLTETSNKNREDEEKHYQEHERHLARNDVDIESLKERVSGTEDDIKDIKEEK